MKSKFFLGLALLVLSLSCTSLVTAQLNFQVALVDFMYVPEGMNSAYVEMEEKIAKPVHQKLVDDGKMASWALYRVPFPGGTGAEYHYVTARVYNSVEQLKQANNFGPALGEVHKGKDMDKIGATIMKTRDLVKTQQFRRWAQVQAPDLAAAPKFLQIVYFKSDLLDIEKHQALEREIYIPMHKKAGEMGKRAGWSGWVLQQPMGSAQAYSHAVIDAFKDWDQAMAPYDYEALFKSVHPNKDPDLIDQQLFKVTDMVKLEEWHLVSITTPKAN